MNPNTTHMTLARFEKLVAAYGGDPGRWPDQERAAAQALLAETQEARDLVAAERALDLALDGLSAPRIPARLEEAIMASRPVPMWTPVRQLAGAPSHWFDAFLRPASIFGSAAVLGIILGLNVMGPLGTAMSSTSSDEILAYALPTFSDSGQ